MPRSNTAPIPISIRCFFGGNACCGLVVVVRGRVDDGARVSVGAASRGGALRERLEIGIKSERARARTPSASVRFTRRASGSAPPDRGSRRARTTRRSRWDAPARAEIPCALARRRDRFEHQLAHELSERGVLVARGAPVLLASVERERDEPERPHVAARREDRAPLGLLGAIQNGCPPRRCCPRGPFHELAMPKSSTFTVAPTQT